VLFHLQRELNLQLIICFSAFLIGGSVFLVNPAKPIMKIQHPGHHRRRKEIE
jgi:hypothetical protein